MSRLNSTGQIIRASSIVGGSAAANVLIGVGRTKLAALLLGPAGVGLIALLQSIVASASQIGGMGLANAAVRQISQAEDSETFAASRRALLLGSIALAVTAAVILVLLQGPVAALLPQERSPDWGTAWVGVAVGLTIIASAQQHLLVALRRLTQFATLNVAGALIGSCVGIVALGAWAQEAIPIYVLAAPGAVVVCGAFLLRARGDRTLRAPQVPLVRTQLKAMLALGLMLMVGNLFAPLSQMMVRIFIGSQLGPIPLGQYAAASMISITYVGLVLGAMATDYYPRISGLVNDRAAVNQAFNEQTEVSLLLGAPLILLLQTTAPWILWLLYSSEFTGAADLLRLLILGDVLKLLGWPMAYLLLAFGRGRTYAIAEAFFAAIFVSVTWLALPRWGIVAAGAGYCAMLVAYLLVLWLLTRRFLNVHWEPRTRWTALVFVAAVAIVTAAGLVAPTTGLLLGLPVTLAIGVYAITRINHAMMRQSPLLRRVYMLIRRVVPT